jgi:hypothetical protein
LCDLRIACCNRRFSRKDRVFSRDDRQSQFIVDITEPGYFPLKYIGQQLLAGHIVDLLIFVVAAKSSAGQKESQAIYWESARGIEQPSLAP